MPLKLNVGLSQKVGENNYGSRGASVNVEMEVESALAGDPGKLKERIRQIFGLVRESLVEELNGGGNGKPANVNNTEPAARNTGNSNGNARNGNGQRSTSPRAATQSQVKALFAITRNQNLDLTKLLQDRFRVNRPDDLNIKEASALIDELKSNAQEGG